MIRENPWHQFNLAEQNPAQGGGILYCLRYSAERIQAHRKNVIAALQALGVSLEPTPDIIGVILKERSLDIEQRVLLLLEELSVQNEALEYHEAGLGECSSVAELKQHMISCIEPRISDRAHRDLPEAYNMGDLSIAQICGDLRIAQAQNSPLSKKEMKIIAELEQYRESVLRRLDGRYVVIG